VRADLLKTFLANSQRFLTRLALRQITQGHDVGSTAQTLPKWMRPVLGGKVTSVLAKQVFIHHMNWPLFPDGCTQGTRLFGIVRTI